MKRLILFLLLIANFCFAQSGVGLFGKIGVNIGSTKPSEQLRVNGIGYVTGAFTANSFVKIGGTSSQFLKANGSIDATTYLSTSSASSIYAPLNSPVFAGNTEFAGNVEIGDTYTLSVAGNMTYNSFPLANSTILGNNVGDMTWGKLTNEYISNTANIDATKVGTGIVSTTELNYLDGVASNIQTQLNSKLNTSTAASTYMALSGNQAITGTKSFSNIETTTANVDNLNVSGSVIFPIFEPSTNVFLKQDGTTGAFEGQTMIFQSDVENLTTSLAAKAPINDATLTGTVILPSTTSIGSVSNTELSYMDGVTSSIQTQLNSKLSTSTAASTYVPFSGGTITGNFFLNNVVKVGGSSTFESAYLGQDALNSITSGTQNVAIGKNSLKAITGGSWNTGLGYKTLEVGTTATKNTAIGAYALQNTTTGQYNTAIGYEAGKNNTVGYNNTFIGGFTGTGFANRSNRLWLSDGLGNVKIMADSLGNVGIATNAPDYPLTISSANNTKSSGSPSLLLFGDSNKERFEIRSSGGDPVFQSRKSGGTYSSPSATAANNILFSLGAAGYDGTGWVLGNRSLIAIKSAENQTPSAQGTYMTFENTPIGSTSRAENLRILGNGNVGIGTTEPSVILDINNTGAIKIPVGTDAQRPASPASGMLRVNTTASPAKLEYYNGASWIQL